MKSSVVVAGASRISATTAVMLYLPLPHWRQIGLCASGLIDCYCQPMVLILELHPLLVKRGD